MRSRPVVVRQIVGAVVIGPSVLHANGSGQWVDGAIDTL